MSIETTLLAINATHKNAKEKGLVRGKGGQSSLPCPVCKEGTIVYSVASFNGHIHAACSKAGCVRWME